MSNSIPRPGEKPAYLIFYIGPQRRPVRVPVKPEGIVIGRNTSDTYVDLDMTDFSGSEHGVSREHVIISPKRDHFSIKDLDTINSTWVNKKRLRPMVSTDLYHGDVIHLAELRLEVHFVYEDDLIDNLAARGSTKRLDEAELQQQTRPFDENPQPPPFDTQVPEGHEANSGSTRRFDDEPSQPEQNSGNATDDLNLDAGVTKRFDD